MKINLNGLGKRFNREWLFRNFNYSFESNRAYAITGPNGSGKSTLLQIIAGYAVFNEGNISYEKNGKSIAPEKIFSQVAIAAPYLELIEELTFKEFLNFHKKLKPLLPTVSLADIAEITGLSHSINKEIRYYSSGMKQRLKLAQAFFSDVPVVLLDEPCTNLDAEGISLYHRLINEYSKDRIFIISSNDVQEYGFCKDVIDIRDIKASAEN